MSKKLLLFPFGGNAREALVSLLSVRGWDVLGFIDDNPATHGRECCGVKVLGGREFFRTVSDALVLAVPGSPGNYLQRDRIIASLDLDPRRFATIIHPSVVIAPDAKIGYNTLIMANVVISCGVTIGNHCVILPNSVVSHDSIIGDYCCVGSNVSVSGSVTIGTSCYIGSGTKMREEISIGAGTLVGIGANVLAAIEAGVIAAGNPARVLRRVTTE